jgi:hypothetical protein
MSCDLVIKRLRSPFLVCIMGHSRRLKADGLLSNITRMACLRRNRIHDTWLNVQLTQTTLGRVGPPTTPGQAGA